MGQKLCIGTLILNEMEWLPKLVEQHLNWEGLVHWVFVEAADSIYAKVNPTRVSPQGLSVDGTTETLERLALLYPDKITHIKFGFTQSTDPAQGKCQARSAYLTEFEKYRPDYFMVVDADEFYTQSNQNSINEWAEQKLSVFTGATFKHLEVWYPPYLRDLNSPLFELEVIGGFWGIPYCRAWKWYSGLQYRANHNTPEFNSGQLLDGRLERCENRLNSPYMVHLGFASQLESRAAKNRYYENRGEALDPKRSWYCSSRAVFESWNPKTIMPRGAEIIHYRGDIPECFQ